MSTTAFVNGRIVSPIGIIEGKTLFVEGSRIRSIGLTDTRSSTSTNVVDVGGMFIAPGYFDSHIHGSFGYDFSGASVAQVIQVLRKLPSVGVTSVLSTIGSSSTDDLVRALQIISDVRSSQYDGTKVIGVHLEGPYLDLSKKGAQTQQNLRLPDIHEMQQLISAYPGLIRMVTVAPELPGCIALISFLRTQNIVINLGHSNGSFDDAKLAFLNGANRMTHFFNAMSPLHHREPGLVGAGLSFQDVYIELILDGFHVDPNVARIAYQIKGRDRVILVTDATQATGLADGKYTRPGNREVYVKDGSVRFASGILAGSVLSMAKAVQNSVKFLNIPIAEAVRLASFNPAESLGIRDIGMLLPGCAADFNLLNDDYSVERSYINGKMVYAEKEGEVSL